MAYGFPGDQEMICGIRYWQAHPAPCRIYMAGPGTTVLDGFSSPLILARIGMTTIVR